MDRSKRVRRGMGKLFRSGTLGIAAGVLLLGSGLSWAGPPNPTPSDVVGNTAGGTGALVNNTNGTDNTAFGHAALDVSTTGNGNTADGSGALNANTTGSNNTASGAFALNNNTTGDRNTASGTGVLFHNTTGVDNTGFGVAALYAATVGNGNTASGSGALGNNTNGTDNTAVGRNAGLSNTTGSRNTLIGSDADANAGVYTNGTALGNGAVLTASNSIVLGNRSISRIFANVATITGISDRRRKKDIKALEADLGLDFIEKLQPVSYRFNNGDETERYGFIAQDLEQALPTSLHDTIEKSEPEHGLALIERPTLQPAPSLRFSPAVLRNVPIRRSGPRAADSPVEGNGFEPSVPLETVFCDCWLSRSAMFISPKSPTARNGDGMFEYRTSDLT